jgi:uncharacterized protein YqeY
MSINEQISQQIKDAMRSKQAIRLRALRGIRAAFISAMKENGAESLSDEVCLTHLKRLAKQRKESISAFEGAGRTELAAEEVEELAVIEAFLPQLADEKTTAVWVQEAIEATGAGTKADMGRVMGHLMKAHRADIDGKLANQLVLKALP